jgi:hypothetical protein
MKAETAHLDPACPEESGGRHSDWSACLERARGQSSKTDGAFDRLAGVVRMLRRPGQESFHANIRIQVRPVNRGAVNFKPGALFGRSESQRWIKTNRHTDKSAILQMIPEDFFVNGDFFDGRRSLHGYLDLSRGDLPELRRKLCRSLYGTILSTNFATKFSTKFITKTIGMNFPNAIHLQLKTQRKQL